jgi:myo-inositol-1(or 4)-monophosphatase
MATKSFTEKGLDDIYAFAIQLGKDAGKLLLEAAQLRFNGNGQATQEFSEKDSAVDIVTKTDEGAPTVRTPLILPSADPLADVEAFIKTSITQKYPDHAYATHSSTTLTRPFY